MSKEETKQGFLKIYSLGYKKEVFFENRRLDLDGLFNENQYICKIHLRLDKMKLNRLKVTLAEEKKTGKWLTETLKKNEVTVSRWCANVSQPSLKKLFAIAKVLEVDVRELLVRTK